MNSLIRSDKHRDPDNAIQIAATIDQTLRSTKQELGQSAPSLRTSRPLQVIAGMLLVVYEYQCLAASVDRLSSPFLGSLPVRQHTADVSLESAKKQSGGLMAQPLFDFDLKRVSREHYITGKAAINFPDPGSTTGGWHFLSYFDRESGVAKVSLAGIHYPDTTASFGDLGMIDVTDELARRRWSAEGRRLYIADHHRAAADMIVKWVLSDSKHCNVEVAEWFPSPEDQQRLLKLLELAVPKLLEPGRLSKMKAWLSSQ